MLLSRHFTTKEIGHRRLPTDMFFQMAASYQMGVMETIRLLIKKKFKKDISITITSGYRSKKINDLTKGAVNSNHIWGLDENGKVKVANDFTIDGSQIDPYQVYLYLKEVLGGEVELIYYERDKHFHISTSQAKEAFIQKE